MKLRLSAASIIGGHGFREKCTMNYWQNRLKMGWKIFFGGAAILLGNGCGLLTESYKIVVGTSTRGVEKARIHGVHRAYECNIDDCFNAVLRFSQENELVVFVQDPTHNLIGSMSLSGSIGTTAVGIFFSKQESRTNVEIASWSSIAQETASKLIFSHLEKKYQQTK